MRSVMVLAALCLLAGRAEALDGGAPEAADAGSELEAPQLPELPAEDGGLPHVSLDEAVRRAIAQNPQAIIARDELGRAEALVTQARAGWLPTLTGNASYTRLDSDRTSNGVVTTPANELNANLNLSVPLFAPRPYLNWQVSKQAVEASRASAEDAHRLVALATGRAYLTALAQHRILEADLRAVAAATAHRDFSQGRLSGGVGNKIDLLRAEQQLASTQSLTASARTSLARAQEALGVLLGEERPVDVADDVTLPAPPSPDTAQQELAKYRKDLEALQARADVADQVVKNKWADYAPFVSAAFQPFLATRTLVTPPDGWTATLALTWPIYDGGLRYGQEREREVLAHEAHQNVDGAVRQARSDVRASFEAVQHADDALVSAREASQHAREALDLITTAYRAGAINTIEVIDAERSALDAETQAAVAEDNARQARLDLLTAAGRFP